MKACQNGKPDSAMLVKLLRMPSSCGTFSFFHGKRFIYNSICTENKNTLSPVSLFSLPEYTQAAKE